MCGESLGSDPRVTCFVCFVFFVASFVTFRPFVDLVAAQSFRSRIDIVQVTVAVTDADGRLITGLTKDDFQVFEDGDRQDITQFTDAARAGEPRRAARCQRQHARPADRRRARRAWIDSSAICCSVRTRRLSPRSIIVPVWPRPGRCRRRRRGNSLASLKPSGGTAIYDALASTSKLFEQRNHVRAAMVRHLGWRRHGQRSLAHSGARGHPAQRCARVRDCHRLSGRAREHARESGSVARDHQPDRRVYRGGAHAPPISALPRHASPTN